MLASLRTQISRAWRPAQLAKPAALRAFSTVNQVYPRTTTVPFTHNLSPNYDLSRQFELQKTLFELSQMRVIPPAIAEKLQTPVVEEKPHISSEWLADSVLRKRRLKMKKHKLRKRRKAQRALRRKLKKD